VECFPTCNHEHSNEKACSPPIGVVLGMKFKDVACARSFDFDKVAFVAEFKPTDASYSVESPVARNQLVKQLKPNGHLFMGKLVATTKGKQHDGDNSVLNGYYEFALSAAGLSESVGAGIQPSGTSTLVYTLAVTVLLPLLDGEPSGVKDEDEVLQPVAHFDSSCFALELATTASACACKEGPGPSKPLSATAGELNEARSLLNLYHVMQCERMALERRALHLQLAAAAGNPHKSPPGRAHSLPSKQTAGCAPLDLVTEDVFEAVYENNAQARRCFQWQSQIGVAVRDPTAGLMQGLVGQSALERALFCITKHNSILQGDIALEDEVDGDVLAVEGQGERKKRSAAGEEPGSPGVVVIDGGDGIAAAEAANGKLLAPLISNNVAVTRPVYSDEASSTGDGKSGARSAAATVEKAGHGSSTASERSDFLSLEHLKAQLAKSYQDPFANLLQRRFFSDMLQSLTEATLLRALQAPAGAAAPHPLSARRCSTAFDLFCAVMGDVKPEQRGLAKAFLASDPPRLGALGWATRYLKARGELRFSTSMVTANSAEAAGILRSTTLQLLPGQDALETAFAQTLEPSAGPRTLSQALDGEASAEVLPLPLVGGEALLRGGGQRKRRREEPHTGSVVSSERDDADAAGVSNSSSGGGGGSGGGRNPALMLAQFKSLVAADSAATSGAAAPSIALVALMTDFVCGGGFKKLRQVEKRSAEARGQLREQLQQSFAAQRALLHEAFLWESSPASLEHVGRSSEFFSSFRALASAPLIGTSDETPPLGEQSPCGGASAPSAPSTRQSRRAEVAQVEVSTPLKSAPKAGAKKQRRGGKSAKGGDRRAKAAPRAPRGRTARRAATEEEMGQRSDEESGDGADQQSDSDSASLMSMYSQGDEREDVHDDICA